MPYAIIRGKNGRRHEVDFGDAPVRVEIHSSEETVEIFIEADFSTLPEERRRFAILNIARHQFSEATGAVARRAPEPNRWWSIAGLTNPSGIDRGNYALGRTGVRYKRDFSDPAWSG